MSDIFISYARSTQHVRPLRLTQPRREAPIGRVAVAVPAFANETT